MKLFAEAMLSVVSETKQPRPLLRARIPSRASCAAADHGDSASSARQRVKNDRHYERASIEANRLGRAKNEPPITLIEFRRRGVIKEYKPVKDCPNIPNFVVQPVKLPNAVHRPAALKLRFSAMPTDVAAASDYLPSKTLMPSPTTPTKPVTTIVITAFNV
jgi:hypothetical protein